MLGTEPQVIESFVNSGQVKLVFWPVLNHGNPSVYATLTADCVGAQDPDLFWQIHEDLFENQGALWRATRDDFVAFAVAAGADQAQFETCYDDGAALARVMALDATRRERGVFSQPVFDINGRILGGAQPFPIFAEALQAALETSTP